MFYKDKTKEEKIEYLELNIDFFSNLLKDNFFNYQDKKFYEHKLEILQKKLKALK